MARDTVWYQPYANPGDKVKLKQPANSYTPPAGLNHGDEVTVTAGWDHSYYNVEKDGKEYRVSFMCLDLPLRTRAVVK